jgi:uncharacterized protein YjiS (DUF1127 family)
MQEKMTTHIYNPTTTATGRRALFDWIGRVYAQSVRDREIARIRRALRALPDAALRDIGIHRSEIGGVANFGRLTGRF